MFDPLLQDTLQKQMEKVGVKIHTKSKVAKITTDVKDPDLTVPFPKTVTLDSGVTFEADAVLFAIGRHALTDDIGIEKVGVKLEKNGDVVVDEYQTTNVPNIFAIGDVQGKELLTPVAIAAGRRLSNRIYGGVAGDKLDYTNVPTVVFSWAPFAWGSRASFCCSPLFPAQPPDHWNRRSRAYISPFVLNPGLKPRH